MVKEPPIQVVNKTRKTAKQKRTKTVRSKSAASGNRKKKKDSEYSSIPLWLKYVILGVSAALFVNVFYYFFNRPYTYRG